MDAETPVVTRKYQNHHLDSTRWEVFVPRDDDIVVTTSYKSGTTWTQQILWGLLHGHDEPMPDLREVSPWVDARFHGSLEDLAGRLDTLPGRRFLKSHLPLDGLPWYPQVKYVIVARDARDVFMSLFNHYSNYTDLAFSLLNGPGRPGPELPRCPDDPRQLWRDWITRGWFEWESEGYPFWSNLHHTQSYWGFRRLPNLLFLHYNDMREDLEGAIRKLADFAGIELSPERLEATVEAATFDNVKARAEKATEETGAGKEFFKGGVASFVFKGTNGRWRGVLTDEDLALYEAAKARVLSPDCAAWLEGGGPI